MIYGNALASAYDALNDGINYCEWSDFLCKVFEKYSDNAVKKICELACGTGSMATELALRGYDVTASDISPEMLTEAESKSRSKGVRVRYVQSDMRGFSLYTPCDVCLCLLDSMNYLTSVSDFRDAVKSVYKNLKSGGLFVFDINSKYKFENVYSDNAYVIENEGVLCAWQNFYNPKSKICDFYLSIFTENKDGSYVRTDEHQRERMYTLRSVKKILAECGFELCGVFAGFDFTEGNEEKDERLYIVAKK